MTSLAEFYKDIVNIDVDLAFDVSTYSLRAVFDRCSAQYTSMSNGRRILLIGQLAAIGWPPSRLLEPFIDHMRASQYDETEARKCWAESMSALTLHFIGKLDSIERLALLAEDA